MPAKQREPKPKQLREPICGFCYCQGFHRVLVYEPDGDRVPDQIGEAR